MTYFYYKTNSWSSQPQVSEDQIEYWKHLSEKRTGELPNYPMVITKRNLKIKMIHGKM